MRTPINNFKQGEVTMPEYVARQGDCIASIAFQHGLFPETIWNHPNNAVLKENRVNQNILHPGDIVFVPEKEERVESCATEQRHRFRRNGIPSKLRLRLLTNGEPRANETYIVDIDGALSSGTTDDEGWLEHPIPPDARRGRLRVGETQDEYTLNLGNINPIGEISGAQERLNNLGFDCGPADGNLGQRTEMALRSFQKKYGLTESGETDEATRNRLVEIHRS